MPLSKANYIYTAEQLKVLLKAQQWQLGGSGLWTHNLLPSRPWLPLRYHFLNNNNVVLNNLQTQDLNKQFQ